MVRVIVDTRERKLYEILVHMLGDIPLEQEALYIGDVQIIIEHDPKPILLIFERKTEKDLAASIKDGRYREQKLRMLHTTNTHHCTYIIENSLHWESHACPSSSYVGAIMNTMYRDGMHVVIVPGIQSTAEWICKVAEKCKEHPHKFVATSTADQEYISMCRVKTKRQENIDVRTCYQLQLCQIPGISQKLAGSIAEAYPSWRCLLDALQACASLEDRVRVLTQIPLIGTKKAQTFLQFIQENIAI
jgi:crossover junction endonuclease MUS81